MPKNHKKKSIKIAYYLLTIIMTLIIIILNFRLYSTTSNNNTTKQVLRQLNFIKKKLQNKTPEKMQTLFPEGYFFSYLLYSLTWVEVGLNESAHLRKQAEQEVSWGLSFLDSEKGRKPFTEGQKPSWGIFYRGWLNWLRGGLLKLNLQSRHRRKFIDECHEIATAFKNSETPFLTSYPNSSWPVDSVVGIAVLCLHDHLFSPKFQNIINNWLKKVKQKLDTNTSLLPHYVNDVSGEMLIGARGTSQSIINRFLPEISVEWSKQQYSLFRKQYIKTILGLPAVKEYPQGKYGSGDVDSGPLILGFSASSSAVTIGAAKVHKDPLYIKLSNTAEMVGLPFTFGNEKFYLGGILPIADAFIVWSRTATLWTTRIGKVKHSPILSDYWRFPFHILSFTFLLLIFLPIYFKYKIQKRIHDES
ncbi:hypothetical protein [Candidatus Uabimicrobium sp. HlEnr_7]|uniref:hypothetical protein n=1 Tax=Candidatus Uabimicrobium helgolandensis TaxID=3095367 RepID=UPI0035567CFB